MASATMRRIVSDTSLSIGSLELRIFFPGPTSELDGHENEEAFGCVPRRSPQK